MEALATRSFNGVHLGLTMSGRATCGCPMQSSVLKSPSKAIASPAECFPVVEGRKIGGKEIDELQKKQHVCMLFFLFSGHKTAPSYAVRDLAGVEEFARYVWICLDHHFARAPLTRKVPVWQRCWQKCVNMPYLQEVIYSII